MAALGDLAAKKVKTELAHLFWNTHYAIDMMRQEDFSGAQNGDTVEVGTLAAFTVNADGSSDQTAEDPSLSALKLIIDQEPMILVHLKRRLDAQMLGGQGKWAAEIAADAIPQMKNYMDRNLFDYLVWSLCYSTTGGYWANPAGDTLTYADFLTAKARLNAQRSSDANRYQFWVDAYAEAAVQTFTGFVPNSAEAAEGFFGSRRIGLIGGIPVFTSAELPGSDARGAYTVASTAYAIASGTMTITVGAGHGIVPGHRITFNTVTAGGDVAASTAVTSVGATSVVLTVANGDSSATEAGTISLQGAVSLLIDTGHVHVGQDDDVQTHIVKREKSTGHNLQVSPLFGRIARAGRVIAIASPRSALTG